MFRPPFLKLPLILLALVLAALFAPPAQAGNNLNMPLAPAQGLSAAGKNKHVQLPTYLFQHPTAILCAVPGGQEASRRISVPAGKKPTDFCPASAITERYYNIAPGVNYAAPVAPDSSPPPLSPKDTGGGH